METPLFAAKIRIWGKANLMVGGEGTGDVALQDVEVQRLTQRGRGAKSMDVSILT